MSEKSDSGTSQKHSNSENHVVEYGPEPWKNPEKLRELYHEKGLSQYDIADYFDIQQPTVSEWMGKLDIEARPPMHERNPSISRSVRADGKVQYYIPDGDGGRDNFLRHQLVVLLAVDDDGEWEYDPSEVFAEGTHVHHELASLVGIDIPCNLSVLGDVEHIMTHAGGGYISQVEYVLGEIFDDYDGEPDQEEMIQWDGDGGPSVQSSIDSAVQAD